MKKTLLVVAAIVASFLSGSMTAKGNLQQEVTAKASCAVPKAYGDFKGMSGQVFIFENPSSGTIKTLTCATDGWHPQIQITRR